MSKPLDEEFDDILSLQTDLRAEDRGHTTTDEERKDFYARVEAFAKRLREIEARVPNNSAPCPHCGHDVDSLYDRIGGDSETGVDEGQEKATV